MAHQPTFYGRNLDEALWKAAQALGREPKDIKFRASTLDEGQTKVEVVNADAIEGDAPAVDVAPVEAVESGAVAGVRHKAGEVPSVPDGLSPEETTRIVLEELLARIGVEAELRITSDDEFVRVELEKTDEDLLLEREGRLLDSLQYLVNRIVQRKLRGAPGIIVDVHGQRRFRTAQLVKLGEFLGDKAVAIGYGIEVDTLLAADRRLIHQALADRRDLRTSSEGNGAFRHLVIEPLRTAD